MKSTLKNKIKYGKVNLPKDAFDKGQFRMTMWIDLDLLREIRKLAEKDGMKYQPWLNKKLRDVILGKPADPVVLDLIKRVSNLEKKLA
jgi:predicted DNA binding CopG/RHH family protein